MNAKLFIVNDRHRGDASDRAVFGVAREIPDLDVARGSAAGGESPTFGVKRDASDELGVATKHAEFGPVPRVPDSDRGIDSRRGHLPAVGTKRDPQYISVVTNKRIDRLARRDVPDFRRVRGDEEHAPVGAEVEIRPLTGEESFDPGLGFTRTVRKANDRRSALGVEDLDVVDSAEGERAVRDD